MGYRAALLNFSKGEISPEVRARFDLSAYQAAALRARNVKIKRTGGLRKRPGTRFVAEALSSSSKLIPFQFSDDQAYAVELAHLLLRPLALGGSILEDGLKITAITRAINAQITAAYHGYTVGKRIYLSQVLGMIEINDRFLTVMSVIDVNNFTVNFDSRGATPFTGDTGGLVRSAPPTPPVASPPAPVPTPAPTPPPVSGGGSGSYSGGGSSSSSGGTGAYQGGFGLGSGPVNP